MLYRYKNRQRDIADDDDTGFLLFAQCMDGYALGEHKHHDKTAISTSAKIPKHQSRLPALIPEDIKLYRILENQVEEFTRSKYEAVKAWLSSKAVLPRPATSLAEQLSMVGTLGGTVDPAKNGLPKDDLKELLETKLGDGKKYTKDGTPPLENLLVVSREEIFLLTHMTQSNRILALPNHVYGHKTASTLIAVSLVVFGALPVAYRSLTFALEYPGWSQVMAASVIGTVSYGIWSSRSMAVTRQSHHVSKAVSSRIFARNDAVLWGLQQGAVQRLSKAIMTLYCYYYQLAPQQEDKNKNSPPDEKVQLIEPSTAAIDDVLTPSLPSMSLLDPLVLAIQLKLIVQNPTQNGGKQETTYLSISLDDALMHIQNKSTQQ
jgi:hypothetical protein